MSQRESGYKRIERDQYETPEWATLALVPHLNCKVILEPACGSGKMVRALRTAGFDVLASDISGGADFLKSKIAPMVVEAIVTNPPYVLAREFIEHALEIETVTVVAMLLRTDFDHAKTREHLFAKCPSFAKKIVLTKRIVWFDAPGAAPSFNHAWYIWDHRHIGAPTLAYGP